MNLSLFLVFFALTSVVFVSHSEGKNASTPHEIAPRLSVGRQEISKRAVPSCFHLFFVQNAEPTGFRSMYNNLDNICQKLPGDPTGTTYFASLFSNDHHIPIYSAYSVDKAQSALIGSFKRSGLSWRADNTGMRRAQIDTLYAGSGYDKGHLVPAQTYSFSANHIASTFTYTNAVPQYNRYNRGRWKAGEDCIRKYIARICAASDGVMHLITGVSEATVTNGKTTRSKMDDLEQPGNKIDIPNSLWTVGCCVWKNNQVIGNIGMFGNNDDNVIDSVKVPDMEKILFGGVGGTPQSKLFPGLPGCSDTARFYNIYDPNAKKCQVP